MRARTILQGYYLVSETAYGVLLLTFLEKVEVVNGGLRVWSSMKVLIFDGGGVFHF